MLHEVKLFFLGNTGWAVKFLAQSQASCETLSLEGLDQEDQDFIRGLKLKLKRPRNILLVEANTEDFRNIRGTPIEIHPENSIADVRQ